MTVASSTPVAPAPSRFSDMSLPRFRQRFMTLVGGVLAVATAGFLLMWIFAGIERRYIFIVGGGWLLSVLAFVLARRGYGLASVVILTYGVTLDIGYFLSTAGDPALYRMAIEAQFMFVVFSAFLATPGYNLGFGILGAGALFFGAFMQSRGADNPVQVLALGATDVVHFAITWVGSTVVSRYLRENRERLEARLHDIDEVVVRADQVATGDLSHQFVDNTDIARILASMVDGLRGIVVEVQSSVQILGTATEQIRTMTGEQERGALHQASAVDETRETLESFAASSKTIAEAATNVLKNAEATLHTSERASERIGALSQHTRRVNELLEIIKDIARKSEILALSAALEGSKAGEAGQGFSLVASQMKQLAESTSGTVKTVRSLTTDITKSTNATVLAIEEATKLASDTTGSAQAITMVTQQQESSLVQVIEAMQDIAHITSEFARGTKDTMSAVDQLNDLTQRLDVLAHRFTT